MKHYYKALNSLLSCLIIFFFSSCEKDFKEAGSIASADTHSAARAINKPNIIFIIGDDIGYEIPTCNGGQSYSTPNIDALAQQGMRFRQCRSAPLCSPSRFMVLTGKYNFRNYTGWGHMDTSEKTIGNMLKDAGYATCYAGKWQLDGGDQSIRTFGFGNYSVWFPYNLCIENDEGSRYKSAKIYENSAYLPDSVTNNKYSEDHFADYVMNFIDSNKSNSFFVYYSMILSHQAFSPTPDDAQYAAWNPDPYLSDKTFFPSMVQYMDKKIGMLINKINTLGIANNTVIFYIGDNGTDRQITSRFQNKNITGAKGTTVEYGIHVPLIIKWPAKVAAASINSDLIDFPDFLPTLAGIANIPVPANYGILDGTSFYKHLTGANDTPPKWAFCHFDNQRCVYNLPLQRYSQDSAYKLYDSTGLFYHFTKDIQEKKPLADSALTLKQRQIKQKLQNVLNAMHK